MLRRTVLAVSAVCALVVAAAFPAFAQPTNSMNQNYEDAIIRPGHVYTVWESINHELVRLAESGAVDAQTAARVRDVPVPAFEEKLPADVYKVVSAFGHDMDLLIGGKEENRVHDSELLEQEMLTYLTLDGSPVTPLTVYLRSVFILEDVTIHSFRHMPQIGAVSGYFTAPPVEGKTPGDVFGLVSQAHMRLHILLGTPAGNGE